MEGLFYRNRCLRTRRGKLLMGPAGNRLFVDYLDRIAGFRGRIEYLQKVNLTEIAAVTCPDLEWEMECMEAVWYPELLRMEFENSELHFTEEKFITRQDEAVSLQTWINKGNRDLRLSFSCQPENCLTEMGAEKESWIRHVISPVTEHGYQFYFYVFCEDFCQVREYILKPGETKEIRMIAVFGLAGENQEKHLIQTGRALSELSADEHRERQKKQHRLFYAKVPSFSSSDAVLNQTWRYRWYILNNCYVEPHYGNYRHGLMYEGRSHKMGKEPFHPTGWEFTKMIPLSTPLHLMDLRWNGETKYGEEMVRSLLDSADAQGEFRVMTADGYGNSYGNFSIWAYWQFYQFHPHPEFLASVLDGLKRYVDCLLARYTDGRDLLQIVTVHQLTGKEYQPSYWYFHEYPRDYKNPDTYTYLKRVDSSVYFYLNLLGLAHLCRENGDGQEEHYAQLAGQLKNEINEKMWDEETEFYYDLHYKTEEKAFVKNIVGFYPWWAEIVPPERMKVMDTIQTEEFRTEYLFPSVSKKCPAYTPTGGWMGDYIKGRDGCVWDGPSWPYTDGIILDTLGVLAKENQAYAELFRTYLHRYALQHFRDGDLERPYLVEHYNPETGEPLSDEPDYNHSYFIDLIMKYVVGIKAEMGRIIVDPLDLGLKSFSCRDISVKGHLLHVCYEQKKGFEVYLDSKLVAESSELKHVVIEI